MIVDMFLFQSWGLAKVQANRTSLHPMIEEMCEIVRSEEFNSSLATLGLRAPTESADRVDRISSSTASHSGNPADQSGNAASVCHNAEGLRPGAIKYAQVLCSHISQIVGTYSKTFRI